MIEPPGPVYPMGVPYHTRSHFSQQEKEAAERTFKQLRDQQRKVIELLLKYPADRGVTSIDCLADLGSGPSAATNYWGPRLTELWIAGMVVRQVTGTTSSGRPLFKGRKRIYIDDRRVEVERGPATIHWLSKDPTFDKSKITRAKAVTYAERVIADLRAQLTAESDRVLELVGEKVKLEGEVRRLQQELKRRGGVQGRLFE